MKCTLCDGVGWTREIENDGPAPRTAQVRCTTCGGLGELDPKRIAETLYVRLAKLDLAIPDNLHFAANSLVLEVLLERPGTESVALMQEVTRQLRERIDQSTPSSKSER